MPRVHCHYTHDVINHTPESQALLGLFALRALISSGKDDIVVLPGMDYPQDEIDLLNGMGLGPKPDNVVGDFQNMKEAAYRDQVGLVDPPDVHPFSATSVWLRKQAILHGFDLAAPSLVIAQQANDKAVFQRRANQAGHTGKIVPRGFSVSNDMLFDRVNYMLREGRPVRIKAGNSASGLCQCVIHPGEKPRYPNGVLEPVSTWVIQEQMDTNIEASVQIHVDRGGGVQVRELLGQHIDNGHHFGNFYPADLELNTNVIKSQMETQMRRAAMRIAQRILSPMGYFGDASIDFVGNTNSGEVWAIEINARVTAPWYAIEASKRRFGKVVPFDMRSFKIPKGTSIFEITDHLKRVLLTQDSAEGFVPFCHLPEQGFCYGVTFAQDKETLMRLTQEVQKRTNDFTG